VSRVAAATPVLIRYAPETGRADAWGRIEELSSTTACLTTASTAERRDKAFLSFEFAGEVFKQVRAEVVWVERDIDGYCALELRLQDEVERRRLARALLSAVAR